ncbi:MAG: hypothetical protein WBD76_03055 [Methyloceanibacter sp.]
MPCSQEAAAGAGELIEAQQTGHTGKIMGMLGTIRGVLGDRQNARVKLPLESLDGGLGLTNQRLQTRELGSVENRLH